MKTGSKYLQSCASHRKGNPESSALHLASDKTLFKCRDPLRVE